MPMSFLEFSLQRDYQADYLGLQYMYKAGYDPNSFLTFFEKIEADEKRQPGINSKGLFHPPTDTGARDRHRKGDRPGPSGTRRVHRDRLGTRLGEGAPAPHRESRQPPGQQESR